MQQKLISVFNLFSRAREQTFVVVCPRTWISNVICHGLFLVQWDKLRWKVIVCFVDIDKIDDRHCLNFLFKISRKEQKTNPNQTKITYTWKGPSWPWSYGGWILQLPMQSVPITANNVSSNPA